MEQNFSFSSSGAIDLDLYNGDPAVVDRPMPTNNGAASNPPPFSPFGAFLSYLFWFFSLLIS